MTLDQIIKLLDAGYTKADIEAMQAPAQPEAAAEPEPQIDPEPAVMQEEKKPESEPVNTQVLQELQDLKKAVYAMNIMNSSQPGQPESVDDILAKALKEG